MTFKRSLKSLKKVFPLLWDLHSSSSNSTFAVLSSDGDNQIEIFKILEASISTRALERHLKDMKFVVNSKKWF